MEANYETTVNSVAVRHEAAQQNEWDQIVESAEFKEYVRKKKSFLVPATAFFLVYYFTLPVLAGYFKPLMAVKVTESINFGYLFALSQFVMAWVLAYVYTKKANKFDATASQMRKTIEGGR